MAIYGKTRKSLFTRILGNDDIFKGLSTFAVEMSELSSILNNADKNSKQVLSLPVHPKLTNDELNYVISSIEEFFNEFKYCL